MHDGLTPIPPRPTPAQSIAHHPYHEEFYRLLEGVVIDDSELFNDELREWEDFYNYARPHGGLGGQTPYERLKQKTTTPRKT
jgi:transposase InsO family protein